MVAVLIYLVFFAAGLPFGFMARPYWERWRAERAAIKAKAESKEKRSASAKAAAARRAKQGVLVETPTGALGALDAHSSVGAVNLNGSSGYPPLNKDQS